ncbi:MAG: porin [Undibacterium sp.]|nr:porin [Undibacterium sp.]
MKKSLIALTVLSAFATTAAAQSSVTLYGVIDVATQYTSNQTATGSKKLSMDASSWVPSRWGVKGSEVIDGDLKANFRLESSLDVDTGTAGNLFNRNATVGLSGGFGSFDAGRQDGLAFSALLVVDPMNNCSAANPNLAFSALNKTSAAGDAITNLYGAHGATNGAGSAMRQNNSIKYSMPAVLGHLVFSGMYGFGEKAGDAQAGSYTGVMGIYSDAGVTASFSYAQLKDALNKSTLSAFTTGAKFVVNDFTLKATYSENEVNTTKRKLSVVGLGVEYAMSPQTTLLGAYYATKRAGDMNAKADEFVGMAKYAFSKRSSVYAMMSYAKAGSTQLKDTDLGLFIGAGNSSANRLTVGMTHMF